VAAKDPAGPLIDVAKNVSGVSNAARKPLLATRPEIDPTSLGSIAAREAIGAGVETVPVNPPPGIAISSRKPLGAFPEPALSCGSVAARTAPEIPDPRITARSWASVAARVPVLAPDEIVPERDATSLGSVTDRTPVQAAMLVIDATSCASVTAREPDTKTPPDTDRTSGDSVAARARLKRTAAETDATSGVSVEASAPVETGPFAPEKLATSLASVEASVPEVITCPETAAESEPSVAARTAENVVEMKR
jgi:hypothetical protein